MAMYSVFSHEEWWFSSSLCKRLPEGTPSNINIVCTSGCSSPNKSMGDLQDPKMEVR